MQKQYGAYCIQPMAERFSVGLRRFFAALLGGTQEKATINRRKMACQRAMFSYEDGAKAVSFSACRQSQNSHGLPSERSKCQRICLLRDKKPIYFSYCPLRHALRRATSPIGRGKYGVCQQSQGDRKSGLLFVLFQFDSLIDSTSWVMAAICPSVSPSALMTA